MRNEFLNTTIADTDPEVSEAMNKEDDEKMLKEIDEIKREHEKQMALIAKIEKEKEKII